MRKTIRALLSGSMILAMSVMMTGCELLPTAMDLSPADEKVVSQVSEEAPASEETEKIVIEEPKEEVQEITWDQPSEEASTEEVVQEPVTMVFAGDINFDARYANMQTMLGKANGIYDVVDSEIVQEMNDADICMINNEFPYSDRGTPLPNKKFTFRAKPSTVENMHKLGVDIVSLANNHAYDHGEEALLDTFDTLDGAGIPYVGAGHNIEEAMKPYYFEKGGMKIGFVSATQIERSLPPDTKEATEDSPGVLRTLDPEKFLTVIEKAKAESDFVVVYVHWGSENVNNYEASQRELAEKYAAAGADLIVGDHPHVLQGFDYVGDVPVLYSLGNFWFSSKTLDNCILKATVDQGEITELKFVPCMQKGCAIHKMEKGGGEYERIIAEMNGWSNQAMLDENGLVLKK